MCTGVATCSAVQLGVMGCSVLLGAGGVVGLDKLVEHAHQSLAPHRPVYTRLGGSITRSRRPRGTGVVETFPAQPAGSSIVEPALSKALGPK